MNIIIHMQVKVTAMGRNENGPPTEFSTWTDEQLLVQIDTKILQNKLHQGLPPEFQLIEVVESATFTKALEVTKIKVL